MTLSPQPESPEPLKVVAWTYTHKISGADSASTWRWHIDNAARELHDEEPLVRLSDAQAAIQAARNEAEAMRADARRLDYLQRRGSTVEILPAGLAWKFRIGGFHPSVHFNIRVAIDAAMKGDAQ